MLWDCTAGEFHWYYDTDETLYVLNGAVVVSDDDGVEHKLGPGDHVHFPAGAHAIWRIKFLCAEDSLRADADAATRHAAFARLEAAEFRLVGTAAARSTVCALPKVQVLNAAADWEHDGATGGNRS